MIRIEGLNKSFFGVMAVDGLSFTVDRGEIFGIVGPDGAGKSTLLRMISGVLAPGGGRVEVGGISVRDNPSEVKEIIAYMPQRFGLYEDLTVEENMFFFGRLFGLNRREIAERIPELYEFSRLGQFGDRPAGKLSGGMKQKLGLACCLIHRPDVVLLDEPTNGVDPVSRREFWKILYSLASGGVTVLVSTSYLDEAERCGRIAMMSSGRFIKTGRPDDIRSSMERVMFEIVTGDVWAAEKVLRKNEGFGGIIREGLSLKAFYRDGKNGAARIKNMLVSSGIGVFSVKIRKPTLENCFMELMAGGHEKQAD